MTSEFLDIHALITQITWHLSFDKLTLRAVPFISFWISLSLASIFSTITRCCGCAQVISIASGLGTRNHQWETTADHVHSSESLDITTNHGEWNLYTFTQCKPSLQQFYCSCQSAEYTKEKNLTITKLGVARIEGSFINLITFFSMHNCITQGIPDYRFLVSRLVAVTLVFLGLTKSKTKCGSELILYSCWYKILFSLEFIHSLSQLLVAVFF